MQKNLQRFGNITYIFRGVMRSYDNFAYFLFLKNFHRGKRCFFCI